MVEVEVAAGRHRPANAERAGKEPTTTNVELSEEQNRQLLIFVALMITLSVAGKILFEAFYVILIVLFPVAYIYGVQTCPAADTFDAKKELKRVLRGYDLPDDHPDKPRGFIGKAFAKAQATVATEAATSMGYEVVMYNMLGACIPVAVRVPGFDKDCFWLGALGKWHYIGSRNIPEAYSKRD